MMKAPFHSVAAITAHGVPNLVDCRRLAAVDAVITLENFRIEFNGFAFFVDLLQKLDESTMNS